MEHFAKVKLIEILKESFSEYSESIDYFTTNKEKRCIKRYILLFFYLKVILLKARLLGISSCFFRLYISSKNTNIYILSRIYFFSLQRSLQKKSKNQLLFSHPAQRTVVLAVLPINDSIVEKIKSEKTNKALPKGLIHCGLW